MSVQEMRDLRKAILQPLLIVLFTQFAIVASGMIYDHFQVKQNTRDIQALQTGTVKSEIFMQYIQNIGEQNKLLKENDEEARSEIRSLQEKNQELLNLIYQRTSRGTGLTSSTK